MHFLYALDLVLDLVRKSSFSKAQGFVKPAPDRFNQLSKRIATLSPVGRGGVVGCRLCVMSGWEMGRWGDGEMGRLWKIHSDSHLNLMFYF